MTKAKPPVIEPPIVPPEPQPPVAEPPLAPPEPQPPAAEPPPAPPPVAQPPVAQPPLKSYRTPDGASSLFDIQIKGEILNGFWCEGRKKVQFNVPNGLVEGFEQHHHFLVGNVAAV